VNLHPHYQINKSDRVNTINKNLLSISKKKKKKYMKDFNNNNNQFFLLHMDINENIDDFRKKGSTSQ
jgi:hypothetical protein